tara:strand:- start:292 stop:591 length:300 start_codon:yes stop_codon:yes gene_type:complete
MLELPDDFPHSAPKGYRYEAIQSKRNVIAIWSVFERGFNYNGHDESYCIWGFYNTKKRQYHAPINSKKVGDVVDVNHTTPYTAMQLNLNGLEQLLFASS